MMTLTLDRLQVKTYFEASLVEYEYLNMADIEYVVEQL